MSKMGRWNWRKEIRRYNRKHLNLRIKNGEENSWDDRPGNQLDVRDAKGFPVFCLRNQVDVLKNEKTGQIIWKQTKF